MGYALAEVAAELGAEVILVSGPTALTPPANVTTVQVQSAQDMLEAVLHNYHAMDVVIKTAAVADYRPKFVYDEKMKKKSGDTVIELERTIDILKTLGEKKNINCSSVLRLKQQMWKNTQRKNYVRKMLI